MERFFVEKNHRRIVSICILVSGRKGQATKE